MWFIVGKAKARDFCLGKLGDGGRRGMTDTWVSEDLPNSHAD